MQFAACGSLMRVGSPHRYCFASYPFNQFRAQPPHVLSGAVSGLRIIVAVRYARADFDGFGSSLICSTPVPTTDSVRACEPKLPQSLTPHFLLPKIPLGGRSRILF